jgi:hypothetical protein
MYRLCCRKILKYTRFHSLHRMLSRYLHVDYWVDIMHLVCARYFQPIDRCDFLYTMCSW